LLFISAAQSFHAPVHYFHLTCFLLPLFYSRWNNWQRCWFESFEFEFM